MISVNLIPESIQRDQQCRRHLLRWTALNLIGLSLLTLPVMVGWVRQSEANRLSNANDDLQSRLSSARTELRNLEAESRETRLRLERARALKSKRAWSSLLAVVGRTLPEGCWLTSVASDPSVPPPPNKRQVDTPETKKKADKSTEKPAAVAIDAPRKLMLSGFAAQPFEPYQLVINLKGAGVFRDVALVNAQREPALDDAYYHFELVCEW